MPLLLPWPLTPTSCSSPEIAFSRQAAFPTSCRGCHGNRWRGEANRDPVEGEHPAAESFTLGLKILGICNNVAGNWPQRSFDLLILLINKF